jgi:hypothetical protein
VDRLRASLAQELGWAIVGLIAAAYVVYFASLSVLPFQDMPNHLARGVIMADLLFHHGAQFGSTYSLQLAPVPYVLHDLLLAACVEVFGSHAGSVVFAAIAFFALPCALLYYLHAAKLAPRARVLVALISLFLATDFFFLMGFMGFRLALALVVVSLGLAQKLRREWSTGAYGAYLGVLVIGYLTHLTAPVFLAGVLAVSTPVRLLLRSTSLRREVALVLPVFALLALHALLIAPAYAEDAPMRFTYFWGTVHSKVQHLMFEFDRFGSHSFRPLVLVLLASLLWPVRYFLRPRMFMKPEVAEALAVAAAFIGLYVFLPQQYADSTYIDVRALAVTALMVVIACLNLPDEETGGRSFSTVPVLGLAAMLAVGNLAYIVSHVGKYDHILSRYRELAAFVPKGATVLTIHTLPKEGNITPLLHAGGFLVIDRDAQTPYLFSGDNGDAMSYFRYRHRPYMPAENWYHEQVKWNTGVERTFEVQGRLYTWRFTYSDQDRTWGMRELTPVDWNRVACAYDYLLATRPLDPAFIGTLTRPIRENGAAALLAVDKSACHPEEIRRRVVQLPSER